MSEFFFAPDQFDAGDFVIRAYKAGDGQALQEAVVESYEHLKPWMPWATPDYSLEQAEANVRRFVAENFRNENYTLGIWRGGEVLGGTGFHLRWGPREWKTIEIGMWIRSSQAGSGLGTKALRAMIQWGFTEWPWERIVWKCDTRNVASARVAEKGGLKLEGTFREDIIGVDGERRDMHYYAILKREWLR